MKRDKGALVASFDEQSVTEHSQKDQDESQKVFTLLRNNPTGLMDSDLRMHVMAKMADLRKALNTRQEELRKALLTVFPPSKDIFTIFIGPKIRCGLLFTALLKKQNHEWTDSAMKKNLDLLSRAGFSMRRISDDGDSLFRAIAFGLLERGTDMSRQFESAEFQKLSSKTRRILKESFGRIKKNPSSIRLEMEMNMREVANAWVTFLHLLAQTKGRSFINDKGHEATLIEELKRKGMENPAKVVQHVRESMNAQDSVDFMPFQGELEAAALSSEFCLPIEIVCLNKQMPDLKPKALLLVKTSNHFDLLYPPA